MISPWLWLAGVPALVAVFLWSPSPLLILVAVLAGVQLLRAWRERHDPAAQAYRMASTGTRLTYAVAYLGLLGFLAVMTHDVHQMLQGARAG